MATRVLSLADAAKVCSAIKVKCPPHMLDQRDAQGLLTHNRDMGGCDADAIDFMVKCVRLGVWSAS